MSAVFVSVFMVVCLASLVMADLRWLRVAQREHYLANSVARFARRWWMGSPLNVVILILSCVLLLASVANAWIAVPALLAFAVGPVGLSVKGRSSRLVWTRRLKSLAALVVLMQVLYFLVIAVLLGVVLAGFLTLALGHLIVDVALAVASPFEKRAAAKFVDSARTKLASVNPTVVAITGSYGKTSTKQYVAHLVAGTKSVLPTPASFNNRGGISRAINEHLSPGTQVFVAEMGTYGPGEIRELCEFVPPSISVITAIGPVHLERFGSEEAIVRAKSEIFEPAEVCVLNVDDDRLAALATELEQQGKKVIRCSSQRESDVRVRYDNGSMHVMVGGREIGSVENPNVPPTNLACAVAVALQLEVPETSIAERLVSLPVAKNRQEVSTTPDGLVVIDDTFNANPASVRRGLGLLARSGSEGGRKVVATPGMVELGGRQNAENAAFAAEAAQVATDLVVIGKTNRKALLQGAAGTALNVVVVDRLPQAVQWMRQHVGSGDAVLYANDLPDHFP